MQVNKRQVCLLNDAAIGKVDVLEGDVGQGADSDDSGGAHGQIKEGKGARLAARLN